jgi:Rrf2 family protein
LVHIFSKQCEYAIQGVLYLAIKPEGEMTSVKELTVQLSLPYHFLGKIMQRLKQKGLLDSVRGPSGGFALRRPLEDITLYHVVQAVDGTDFPQRCILGFTKCSGSNPCPVHDQWRDLSGGMYRSLANRSILEIAASLKRKRRSKSVRNAPFLMLPIKSI